MSKGKSTNDLKRRSGNKNPRKNFLIVVEGKETEYSYFKSLKDELKLSTTKIEIVTASCGDPLVIVNEAFKYKNSNRLIAERDVTHKSNSLGAKS